MQRKMLKKITAFGMSLAMITGSVSAIPAKAAEDVTVDIYPVPQKIEYISTSGMQFDGTVNLVVHGEQNKSTVMKVKELLNAQGIAYEEGKEIDDTRATVLISSDKAHCEDCAEVGDAESLSEEQGYALVASDDGNPKGKVTIVGADKDGAFYGVMSFAQMLEQKTEDGKFAEVSVYDYPSIKLRGFVEGFYGYPWSFEDRLSLISDSSKFKMNTYIYAPKDDPYHKDQWREPYPADKAEELRQLAKEAKKDNVSFCWSAHPGYGWNYNSDADHNALMAKFEQLYDLGVRQFGISYDDLSGYTNGTQHAQVINRINEEFVKAKGDVKPLIVVATRYCNGWGPDMQSYFKPFMETLDEDVVVMWTGANTMSPITKEAYEWPKQQTGVDRDLAAWWNYPVNDYCDGKLMMSPLENLDNDVDNLSGFFLNPMSQAEASKVAIISGADYSWNVSAFEKMSSWKRAIKELVPDANEEFERFADNSSFVKDGFEFDESRYLVDKIEALNEALRSGSDVTAAAEALKVQFELMKSDVVTLRNIENKAMLEEISIFLDAYDVLADAGIASMEAFVAAQKGDIVTTLAKIDLSQKKLKETENFTITSLEGNGTKENIVNVGEKRIKLLIRDSAEQIQAVLKNQITTKVESKVFSTDKTVEGTEVLIAGGNYAISNMDAELESGGYIGFNLPSAMKLSEIRLDSNHNDAMEIQYSLNGIEWKKADTKVVEGVLKTSEPVGAAYVRVMNKSDQAITIHINELKAIIVYSLGEVTATTDLSTYQNNYIANAVDGNFSTKFYSSAGSTLGSYVRVDFGKAIPLYDLTIYYSPNPKGIEKGVDGFKKTKLEISTDGVTWKQIGDVINYLDYTIETVSGVNVASAKYNAEGEMARYIRFSAAEAYDNWVQVYEVEYNKAVSNIGDANVPLVDANFEIENAEYLYDGDLSTAMTAQNVKDGDYLAYKTTTITNVGKLMIVQDADNLCGAAVSVKTTEGKWKQIGALDTQVTELTVDDVITEIKFTFKVGNPLPKIYEVIALERTTEAGDKADLTALIEYARQQQENADYEWLVPVVKKAFEAAFAEAEAVNVDANATQKEIDAAYEDLLDKVHLLGFIGADTTNLKVKYDALKGLNLDVYTEESAKVMEEALKMAEKVLADENALKDEIEGALADLIAAEEDLERIPVNKEKLKGLIAKGAGYMAEADKYVSTENLKIALESAKTVYGNADATQKEVDVAYNVLLNAIFDLRLIPNKDKLEELLDKVEKMDLDKYTEETANTVRAAYAKALAVFEDEDAQQSEIDAAVASLNVAVGELVANAGNEQSSDDKKDDGKADDAGSKDKTGTINNTKNSPKTEDTASVTLPIVTGFMALLGVWFVWKKK